MRTECGRASRCPARRSPHKRSAPCLSSRPATRAQRLDQRLCVVAKQEHQGIGLTPGHLFRKGGRETLKDEGSVLAGAQGFHVLTREHALIQQAHRAQLIVKVRGIQQLELEGLFNA